MKILVLGGGGFVGSHLVERLSQDPDLKVSSFDSNHEKLVEALGERGGVSIIDGDIAVDLGKVQSLIRGSDLVIDLIAHANPSLYVSNPLDVVDLNFHMNLEIVDACSKWCKDIVQFSSCEVYGPTLGRTEAFSEDHSALITGPVLETRWIYASAKQLLERIVAAKGGRGDFLYAIIRPFNFIGPRIDYLPREGDMGGPRVFSHFMAALLAERALYLVNGGLQMRSYTDIRDAVEGIMIVIRGLGGRFRGQVVNVGNPGNEMSIKGLALLMKEIYAELTGKPSRSEMLEISGEQFYGKGYADCDRRIPDASKLVSAGWEPKYGLRDAVKNAMGYYIGKLKA